MHAKKARMLGRFAEIAAAVLIFGMSGCGGGGSMGTQQHTPPPPPPPAHSMQGAWILLFHSDVSVRDTALEANLSQFGDHVFADKTNALVFQPVDNSSTLLIRLKSLGGKCDSGAVGDVTVDATFSKSGATGLVSLTLSETGALGSVVTTASSSSNGLSISDGTYSAPAGCGFPEDHGTFTGYQDSFAFFSGTYSGHLNGGVGAIVAKVGSANFGLTMSGTANGTPFVLNGSTVGLSSALTGTVAGGTVNWFGLYDPTYNVFNIYDSDSTFLGALSQ